MLELDRKLGETIKVGANITVTVIGIGDQAVRLGVNAPDDRSVHRQEIYERIQLEKKQ